MCHFITGKRTIGTTWSYGISHEKQLWNEFNSVLDSSVTMRWFSAAHDIDKNRPGSLAYFIGYRICESYFNNALDKKEALNEIIKLSDPKKIYMQSKYLGNYVGSTKFLQYK